MAKSSSSSKEKHHYQETGTSPHKLRLVSLFAGAGGIDIGFEATGLFHTAVAADWADYSINTLRSNQQKAHKLDLEVIAPWLTESGKLCQKEKRKASVLLENTKIIKADLSEKGAEQILSAYAGPIDVVAGGPPCQAFSVRNRRSDRGLLDTQGRGNLIFSFMEIVRDLRPRAFMFENVMGLDRSEHGNLVEELTDYARNKLGYKVTLSKVVASNYGLPQDRRRIIIVGTQSGFDYSPPEPSHGQTDLFDKHPKRAFVTVREALESLPAPDATIYNHIAPNHTQEMMERFATVAPGKQDPIRKKIRLHPDRPCPALFSGSDTGGGLADIHPWHDRALTPRECARLQGFPDFWELCSRRSGEVHKLVANAVPPPLASAFAVAIAAALKEPS